MKALNFLVYSNIWISLGAGLLSLLTFQIFSANTTDSTHVSYSVFVFFCTLFSYNFQRITRIKKIEQINPHAWVVIYSKTAKIILVISAIGAAAFVPIFNYPFTLGWLILLGVISFGYSYRKLRDLPHLKILLIATSWGITCGLLPLIILNNTHTFSFIYSFGWIFFYILAITIPFDIRDMEVDETSKRTLPQWMGIEKSKKLGYLMLVLSAVCLFPLVSQLVFGLFVGSYLVAGFLIKKSSANQKDFYYSFYVDGHIIFQFLAVYFLA